MNTRIGCGELERNPIGMGGDQAVESFDYVIDRPKDCLERIPNWEDLIRGDNSPLKRYIEGKLCVHMHLRVGAASRDGELDCGDYCVVVGSAIRGERAVRRFHPWGKFGFDHAAVVEHVAECEQLVFIARVKVLKHPEKICLRVRSVIRLQHSDLCDRLMMELPQSVKSPRSKADCGLENRPHGVAVSEIGASEPPSDIIKGRASVMDTISYHQRPMSGRQRSLMPDSEKIPGLFSIVLTEKEVGLAFQECGDFFVKAFKMFLSTTQFMPTFD